MKRNPNTMPGPGDPETWPAYAGAPNDPREPAEPEFEALPRAEQIERLLEDYSASELAEMLLVEWGTR